MSIDTEKEAAKLLQEIERKFPSERCSLREYRAVLMGLEEEINERINQLNDELDG